jgi:hypothetical protein
MARSYFHPWYEGHEFAGHECGGKPRHFEPKTAREVSGYAQAHAGGASPESSRLAARLVKLARPGFVADAA